MSERELPELNAGITGVSDESAVALSAAMASLFGDASESWLLEADDVLEHLRMSGYRIVSADRLERLQDTTAAAKEFTDTLFLRTDMSNEQSVAVARELGVRIAEAVLRLQPGDLDPIDPVAPGEGER